MSIYLIHNSKDMHKYLIPTMKNIWFCINALKLLITITKKLEHKFHHMKHGNTPRLQSLTFQPGHKQSMNLQVLM
jgi:hypothetical protein